MQKKKKKKKTMKRKNKKWKKNHCHPWATVWRLKGQDRLFFNSSDERDEKRQRLEESVFPESKVCLYQKAKRRRRDKKKTSFSTLANLSLPGSLHYIYFTWFVKKKNLFILFYSTWLSDSQLEEILGVIRHTSCQM